MGPKKHRKRDSSSSNDSDSSREKSSKKSQSEHHRSKQQHSGRTRKQSSSDEFSSSKPNRSRSRSNERRRKNEDRNRSADNTGHSRDRNRERSRDRDARQNNYRDRNSSDGRSDRYESRNRRGNDFRRKDFHSRRSRSKSFDHANAKWGKHEEHTGDKKKSKENKAKPDFGLSGKLTEETNTYRGVVIKYSEPPEARKPRRRWRLYPFKGDKALQTLYIHRESAYLIGRDRKVVDLPVDHPSCSKQHAALQYRLVPFTRENGSTGKRVRPYLIDLESANGTFINNKKIEPKKYVELLEKDVIKFGFSSREYVLLHENSKDEAMDDDVKGEEEIKQEPEVEVKGERE
ncbi:smad nuclear interacting protein 1 isoform X2 [Anthonomus grandis grandis]|uniref:smad nuclear interacting protein 1 isoform X2 n=1 Tax=Anthonomus grandis grandis TaxID=2921223 RepID=UPI002164F45A|nr:smad nuclear interacting protein 1 isoform X2 [Anthonomus grandis grandis]